MSMNVYRCLYHGNMGYGCRTRGRKWMFVPELGQSDHKVYKNLLLDDLLFVNPFDRKFEHEIEKRLAKTWLLGFIKWLFNASSRSNTMGGLLLTTR